MHLYFMQILRQVINESQKEKGRKEKERKGTEGERKEGNRKEIESSWCAREKQKRYIRKLSVDLVDIVV